MPFRCRCRVHVLDLGSVGRPFARRGQRRRCRTRETAFGSGADVAEPDSAGEPALLIASLAGRANVVALLLEQGSDIEIRNKHGFTALHAAAYGGNLEVVELLVSKGAAVNDTENFYRMSPLHAAAEEGHAEVVAFLLANKASVEAQERNGYTPLTPGRLARTLGCGEPVDESGRGLSEGRSCRRLALQGMHQTTMTPVAAVVAVGTWSMRMRDRRWKTGLALSRRVVPLRCWFWFHCLDPCRGRGRTDCQHRLFWRRRDQRL